MPTLASFAYPISNVIIPQDGPKCAPTSLDFSNAPTFEIDGQQLIDGGQMEFVQGVYIDNASNAVPFELICALTQHRVTCPSNSQGFFSLLIQSPPKLTANMAQSGNRIVKLLFYNVPIMPNVWKCL